MKVLVTGAAGFLGSRLIRALLAGGDGDPHVDGDPAAGDRDRAAADGRERHAAISISSVVAADLEPCAIDDPRVDVRTGSITEADYVASIVDGDVELVYHLAAVLSGQSEAEFDLGMEVNVDATRRLLEACRRLEHAPRFVFSSSLAVFGGALPAVVPDDLALMPQSSYGVGKAVAELLVNEYTRRGFIDGLVCRLPTISVRGGTPNSAASSFVSGIIREPLNGLPSVCPVPLDTKLWISSPATAVANLVHAATVPASLVGPWRSINVPGLTVTPEEMLDSLRRLGGAEARARVHCEEDARVASIVCSWPGAFDVGRALRLGFEADEHIDAVVRQYLDELGRTA